MGVGSLNYVLFNKFPVVGYLILLLVCTFTLGLPMDHDGSLKRDLGHFLPIERLPVCSNSKLRSRICPSTATPSTSFLDQC